MKEMKKIAMITVILLVAVMAFAEINIAELEAAQGNVSEIIEYVNNGETESALNEIAKLRNAISKTEAELRGLDFRGDVKTLFGPVEIPAGVYKVYFLCKSGNVSLYDMNGDFSGGPF